jgi:predicted PurR-regulated permease PerM
MKGKEEIVMEQHSGNSAILRALLIGASLFIIIFGMRLTSSIISPIFLALIIAISVTPLMDWLKKKGLSIRWTLLITIIIVVGAIVGLVALFTVSINQLIITLPQYSDGMESQTASVQEFLAKINPDSKDFSDLATFDTGKIMGFVGSMLGGVAGTLSSVVLVLMVLIFMLLATPGISTKLQFNFDGESPTMQRVNGLVGDLRQYVSITTWINFLVGLVNTVLLFIMGVDFPVLWGLLAFLLGYIPTVGFWLALIPPTILAFLEFGAVKAMIVFVGYVVINGGVQNFLQPKLMGDGLNLSPLFVVLSLFFWSWILGPMGALLAIPLTMVVKDGFLDAYDETRGLSDLMSSGGAPSQEPAPIDTAK